MPLAQVKTRALNGVSAVAVEVEVLTRHSLPGINIVGLPEAAVRESKDRVRGAIKSSGFRLPGERLIINLAPADLPKEGGRYDLPIAIGILAATGQIDKEALDGYEFSGELALSGRLRRVNGVLPIALACAKEQRELFIPSVNGREAALVSNVRAYGAANLYEVCAHINNINKLKETLAFKPQDKDYAGLDFKDVKGQEQAKRALEIAAAGGHNLLFIGPPGSGKTMLAGRLPSIMTKLNEHEAIESASVSSISGKFKIENWRKRPFRSPHHTSSGVALVGGGSMPRPGEISLAHNGVLFLDELPEFDRKVLEVLREPMESGVINISRAARQAEFPAKFQLVAAMNPCPCGYLGDLSGRCHCTSDQIRRYRGKISGPLMDRVDIHLEVPKIPVGRLQDNDNAAETSSMVRKRVQKARNIQLRRSGKPNNDLQGKALEETCALGMDERKFLQRASERLNLSARGYHKVLKIARTIADLAGDKIILKSHIGEAIGYRTLDRKYG